MVDYKSVAMKTGSAVTARFSGRGEMFDDVRPLARSAANVLRYLERRGRTNLTKPWRTDESAGRVFLHPRGKLVARFEQETDWTGANHVLN
jgi:hypothetical protein